MQNALARLSEESQKEFWATLALRYCPKMTQRLLRSLLVRYGSAYSIFCHATNKNHLLDLTKEQTKQAPIFLQNKAQGKDKKSTKPFPKELPQLLLQEKWREPALQEWREAKVFNGEIILWTDYRYPLELKQLIDAPAFFYAKGDISLLSSPSVAIVGSRKFHTETLKKTREIAEELSAYGICIVSGMAKGIDYAAHKGALKNIGKTIAVLGSGADIIYPQEHKELYEDILKSGLIISEFSPKTPPNAKNFPIRNRIVSGLSQAVLVAEAELRSGSLITTRIALEQNRPIYALAPLHENHSLGTQNLINDGAIQIEDALSIIADIAPHLQSKIDKTGELITNEILTSHASTNTNTPSSINTNTTTTPKSSKNSNSKSNSTILDIDFKTLTQELMGEEKNIRLEDILGTKKQSTKSKASTAKQEKNIQNQELISINTTKNSENKISNKVSSTTNNKKSTSHSLASTKDRTNLDTYDKKILEILDTQSPLSPDDILLNLKDTNISTLTTALLMLEVDGYLVRLSGNRYDHA